MDTVHYLCEYRHDRVFFLCRPALIAVDWTKPVTSSTEISVLTTSVGRWRHFSVLVLATTFDKIGTLRNIVGAKSCANCACCSTGCHTEARRGWSIIFFQPCHRNVSSNIQFRFQLVSASGSAIIFKLFQTESHLSGGVPASVLIPSAAFGRLMFS